MKIKKKQPKPSPDKRQSSKNIYKFKVGDVVRLSKIQGTLGKESSKKWTDEMFTIASRSLNQGIPKYQVKDFHNDPIIDKFSSQELQKVIINQDKIWTRYCAREKREEKRKFWFTGLVGLLNSTAG